MESNVEKLEKAYERARQKQQEIYHSLCEARIGKVSEAVNGKYVKYYGTLQSYPHYMFVDRISYSQEDRKYTLCGYGFFWDAAFPGCTFFGMDYWDEIHIYGIPDTIEEEIKKNITIITEEEFDQTFNEFSEELKKAHADKMEALRKKNEKTV